MHYRLEGPCVVLSGNREAHGSLVCDPLTIIGAEVVAGRKALMQVADTVTTV